MTRLPQLTDDQVGPPELVASIRQRRGGNLMELDRLLLHSPAFATGWGELMGRVRGALALPPLLRELAMCGVAAVTGAAYELHHHAPLYQAAGGSPAQLAALRALAPAPTPAPAGALANDPVFDDTQQAVLALVLAMTRDVQVSDAVFDRARAALGSDKLAFELVGVIASYNMVARILVVMKLEP